MGARRRRLADSPRESLGGVGRLKRTPLGPLEAHRRPVRIPPAGGRSLMRTRLRSGHPCRTGEGTGNLLEFRGASRAIGLERTLWSPRSPGFLPPRTGNVVVPAQGFSQPEQGRPLPPRQSGAWLRHGRDARPSAARSGCPRATRNMTLLPAACGEKNSVTSSSKKVSPVAPKRCA